MKKHFAILGLFAISIFPLFAATISGKLIEPTNAGVGFASVICYTLPDSLIASTCIADSSGNFVLKDIGSGKYCVKCQMQGFSTLFLDSVRVSNSESVIALGSLKMSADTKQLNDLLVIAEPNNEGGIDKSRFKISEKLISIAPTGVDVLKYVPSVQVNLMQEISVDGSTNVQYLIDGRKVAVEDVKQIDARKIASVEVVHNPSSKYDADITAVINIILKTDVKFGFSGKVSTETHISTKTLTNNRIALEYGLKKLRFFCDAHYNLLDIDYEESVNNRSQNLNTYLKEGNGRFKNYYSNINTGVDWKINKQNNLLYQFQYKPQFGERADGSNTTDYQYDGLSKAFAKSDVLTDTKQSSIKNYIYYKHAFATPAHEITLTGEYTYRLQDISNSYSETLYKADRTSITKPLQTRDYNTENNKYDASFSLDYSLPLGKSTSLKAGYNLNSQHFRNKFNILQSSFDYDEFRNSVYLTVNQSIKGLSLQAGLRYEQSDLTLNDTTDIQYHIFLPQASLQYKINKMQKIKLSYRRAIGRPMVQNMNPFVEEQDSLHISLGNPGLDPTTDDKLELSYQWLFRTSIYYKSFSDMLQPVSNLRADGVFENTFANASDGIEYGWTLGTTLPLRKWWNINLYGSVFKQEMFEEAKYNIAARSNLGSRIYVSSMFQLPKDITISTMFYTNSASINSQTSSVRPTFYGLGVDKKFKSSLTLGLMWINPFATIYNFKNETTYGNGFVVKNKTGADISHLINFKLTYNFNKGNKLEKLERPKGEDEDGEKKMF